ncbi:hypothetical protein Spiaf_2745 [Spirochaeta africana DSM 8902]|uniref:Uncharacterized protein n=1 Tax=Spirochaeta africana (strain ATCC 700263 / DSM 8902 / Z-7692) TaxID=889378 RepID=H9UMM6_SPIAZ|nr:hypothetical protein Spiaf_2745 [Spirochaeta africana DSM 8902]
MATGLILLAAACSDAGMLMPNLDRQAEVTINPGRRGAIVRAGEPVSVELQVAPNSRIAEGPAPVLQVRLYDADGEEIARQEMSENVLGSASLPDMLLPDDLEDGYYELRYRLYQQERLVASTVRPIFLESAEYSLSGISVYPSRFEPDSQGILQLGIQQSGAAADPFIVWRFDGGVKAFGLLSEGMDEVQVQSPERDGVYTVRVDVYPAPPPDGVPFEFAGPRQQRGEVVVSSNQAARSYELQPRDSYYSLLRLNGNLRDIGMRNEAARTAGHFTMSGGGVAQLVIEQGRLGHRIPPDEYLQTTRAIFPGSGENAAPFTVTFRGRFGEAAEREDWIHTEGGPYVQLYSEAGQLHAVVGAERSRFSVQRSIIPADESVQWSFSYLVEGDTAYGMWLINGILIGVDSRPVPAGTAVEHRPEGDEGRTRIAAGVTGVLEEFGVYYRNSLHQPSINTGEFRRAMELQYPHTLIFAESFAGQEAEILGEQEVAARGAVLRIAPGESVQLPDVFFRSSDVIFELLFSDPDPAGYGMVQIQGLDESASAEELQVPLQQDMQLRIGREDDQLIVRGQPEQRVQVSAVRGVSVTITNRSDSDVVLGLRHVLARHAERSSSVSIFDPEN